MSRDGVGGSLLLPLPAASSELTPFEVHVPEQAVNDLHSRLRSVRWPEKEPVSDWTQGVPLSELQDLTGYWLDGYDWRRVEAEINSLPNYRTELDGLSIHFIHVRSSNADALPLLVTHGWPGSVVEFLDTVRPLVDPARHRGNAQDAFHLVIPSLPGFGFSDRPGERGWNHVRIARAWGQLMRRLGYGERWVAQGGDWGSVIVHVLAKIKPEGLRAVHTNWPLVVPAEKPDAMSSEEQRAWDQAIQFRSVDNGYWREQATRPQTLGYALADSPVGLAAWISEKFHAWTDNHGKPQDAITNDRMLDNISTYVHRDHRIVHEALPRVRACWSGPVQRRKDRLSDRGQHLPAGDVQSPEGVGGAALVRHRVLERGRPWRPLRRHGAARDFRQRAAQRVSELPTVIEQCSEGRRVR
ncbi:MAG: epoxide hydrolase [Solirubrobacteraceae bacterium]